MSTELAPVVMDADDARRLTERIRLTAYSARESIARLHDLVDEAKAGSAHLALGYPSWTAYLADVFGEEPLRLARDQRQELVGYLAGEGMSIRAIASVTDMPKSTVGRIASGVPIGTPEPAVDRYTGEVLDPTDTPSTIPQGEPVSRAVGGGSTPPVEDAATSGDAEVSGPGAAVEVPPPPPARPVTGLDGKTYTRAVTKPAPRRDLGKQFFDAAYDLTKNVERVHRLTSQALAVPA